MILRMKNSLLLLVPFSLFAQAPTLNPDTIGMVYAIDNGGTSLARLEKGTFFTKKVVRGGIATKTTTEAQVQGEHSPVHLSETGDRPVEFMVRMPPGGDPTKFILYEFDEGKGYRVVTLRQVKDQVIRTKVESEAHTFKIEVKAISDNVYRLVPTQKLPQGEYGFGTLTANDAFCFSVQ